MLKTAIHHPNLGVSSCYFKLAEISQQAAAEIVQSSGDGKEVSEMTSQMLTELLPVIEKTKDLVQGISAASEEQHSGAAQINLAIQELERVIQQNASASEEMAATAATLSEQAQELQQTMRFFTLDGGAKSEDEGTVLRSVDAGVESAQQLSIRERADVLEMPNRGNGTEASEVETHDFKKC